MERERPQWKGKTYMGLPYITGEAQWESHKENLKEYEQYLKSLPSIQVSDDLKKVFKEGQRYVEGKDFKIDYSYPMGESLGQEQYASIMQMKYGTMALPVNTLQEEKESQRDLWVEVYDHMAGDAPIEFIESKYHITRIKQ